MVKALFLDRDGIINREKNYLFQPEQVEWVEETLELMKKAYDLGYKLFIVSNQAGIAKGKFSEKDYLQLDFWMRHELEKMGFEISESYYCPFHEEAVNNAYRMSSRFRKPNPGMLQEAIRNFNIDPNQSILLGDRYSDILAGYNAGVKNLVLLEKEYSYRDYKASDYPDVKFFVINSEMEIINISI